MAEPLSECPPGHLVYDSEMLAENAVTLHQLSLPDCPGGIHVFPCGDHFHIGHRRASQGDRCKEQDDAKWEQRATKRGWNRGRWASQNRRNGR